MKKAYIRHQRYGVYTSESVSSGHPDKICDQIADRILDEAVKESPNSRVACEVLATKHAIMVGGEITTSGYIDVLRCVWDVIKPLGYREGQIPIISSIHDQSAEISHLVHHRNGSLGAGDQGITIGYAVAETETLMPLGTQVAHKLLMTAENALRDGLIPELNWDMKSQVSLRYHGHEVWLERLVLALQHQPNIDFSEFRRKILNKVVAPVLMKAGLLDTSDREIPCLINAAGSFVVGGIASDTGLTGRKLAVDTYGIYSHHGGGAFSGKDYTKVDRLGAYYARWIAKHIVALKWATECEVRIAWAIGQELPLSIDLDCSGTNTIPLEKIIQAVHQVFLRPIATIANELQMDHVKFSLFSVYGHFGKEFGSWEELRKTAELESAIK